MSDTQDIDIISFSDGETAITTIASGVTVEVNRPGASVTKRASYTVDAKQLAAFQQKKRSGPVRFDTITKEMQLKPKKSTR